MHFKVVFVLTKNLFPVKLFPRTTLLIFESQLKTYIVIFYDHHHRRDVSQKKLGLKLLFLFFQIKNGKLHFCQNCGTELFHSLQRLRRGHNFSRQQQRTEQQVSRARFPNNSAKSLCVRRLQNLEAATARFLRTLAMTGDFHINFRYPKAVVLYFKKYELGFFNT